MTKPKVAALPKVALTLLSTDDRFERCPRDLQTAVSQVSRIEHNECEDVLHAASQGRWLKANTYAYDAARKAVLSLLLAHGWRVRNVVGAHQAIGEFVDHWLGSAPNPGPRIATTFHASRKARHDDEYPHPHAPDRTPEDLRVLAEDDIRLMNAAREALGLSVLPELVPTKINITARLSS